ncbi:recombinational DNA repair protein RecR [Arthrobacter ginsengisoli]|uniref:Recombinational DNA repair protein RecR n=1 Tax=Arthrobacter ginsengisoli TaxID=1356565 RepID=A0ABU1UDF0_9MICC|nr:recombinational DNA repair protein RecR [Arthrobacter ginsengisoli]
MATYITEAKALEHRCQCCGELAESVFCDDCTTDSHNECL